MKWESPGTEVPGLSGEINLTNARRRLGVGRVPVRAAISAEPALAPWEIHTRARGNPAHSGNTFHLRSYQDNATSRVPRASAPPGLIRGTSPRLRAATS